MRTVPDKVPALLSWLSRVSVLAGTERCKRASITSRKVPWVTQQPTDDRLRRGLVERKLPGTGTLGHLQLVVLAQAAGVQALAQGGFEGLVLGRPRDVTQQHLKGFGL